MRTSLLFPMLGLRKGKSREAEVKWLDQGHPAPTRRLQSPFLSEQCSFHDIILSFSRSFKRYLFIHMFMYMYIFVCLCQVPAAARRILYLHCDTWNLLVVACRVFSYCSWGSQGMNAEVVWHSLLQGTTFCQNSPPGEGDKRGQDGWMTLLTQWTWVWASSRSWWWTGKPGVLQSMGLQRVRHDWANEEQQMQNLQLEHENSQFMWDPVPWLNPSPLHWECGAFTTGPPGKSPYFLSHCKLSLAPPVTSQRENWCCLSLQCSAKKLA